MYIYREKEKHNICKFMLINMIYQSKNWKINRLKNLKLLVFIKRNKKKLESLKIQKVRMFWKFGILVVSVKQINANKFLKNKNQETFLPEPEN